MNNKKIVLLGDSILENSSYANPCILEILKSTSHSVLCLAQDNSTIESTYLQLHDLPSNLNNRNTFIFVSVGGNDILNKFVYKDIQSDKHKNIHNIFHEYISLVLSLKKKMNLSNIILLNIYYPYAEYYKSYYPLIKEWNNLLKDFCLKNGFKLLNIADIMTMKEDFSFDIEPSSVGSQKISKAILKSL
jgi:lysophospholipase L1-like esterase